MKYRLFCLAMAAALAPAGGCGDDDDDGQQEGPDGGAGSGGEGDAGPGEDGGEEEDGGGFIPLFGTENCPNGELEEELGEECDDGDLNDRDGCTRLCEFTCVVDDDCDDLNICNGTEVCDSDHICRPGKEEEEGVWCGPDQSCWRGICVANTCGDTRQQGDEQCDDGDADDSNGCTRLCEFTCEDDGDCAGGDECAGADTCNTADHTCTGDRLADETVCTIVGTNETGWCQSGVCVPTNCGNEQKEGAEECDLGDQNGVKGSGCSIDCKITQCGDGKIQVPEQCDDGGFEPWDGCDPDCRAELVHRLRTMHVMTEPAPEFCEYPGQNRLAEAFPEPIVVPGFMTFDVVDFVNQAINGSLDNGEMHPLAAVVGSSDTSMRTTDKEVELALVSGAIEEEPWGEAGARPRLDYPYLVQANSLQDGKPINSLPAEQIGGGYLVTTEPSDLVVTSPLGGNFELRELTIRTIFDPDKLSTPEPLPDLASGVVLPEESGVPDEPPDPYHPAGRMCGVQPLSALAAMPLFAEAGGFCCDKDGGDYTGCAADQFPPDCSSLADVLLGGCKVCLADPLNPMGGVDCSPGCTGLQIVEPIEPDADLDDDGENDGYTTVMAFESIRIRVRGLTE